MSQEFKDQNRENLYTSTVREGDFENTDFYELPFDKVVDLISDRKVYLHKGIAYVPQNDLITVFLAHFRTNLSIELNVSYRLSLCINVCILTNDNRLIFRKPGNLFSII